MMTMVSASTLFFENAAGQVLTDPAGFLRSNWSAQARTLADTQEFLSSLTSAMQQYGVPKVLSNQTAMISLTAPEQAWVSQEWLPQAVQAGYRACAVVLATSLYARLAMAYVTTSVQGLPMRYRSFDDEAEAIDWLLNQR